MKAKYTNCLRIRLEPEMNMRLRKLAYQEETTLSRLVREILHAGTYRRELVKPEPEQE